MCDFNVQVTFNTQQHTFTFAPSEVTIPKKSTKTICLNLSPVTGLKFTGFTITDSADFSWTVADDTITVTDNNQDAQTTEHPYNVTVEYGGASYTSDPKIINRG